MKVYRGTRTADGGCVVTVNGRLLDPAPSQRVRNHSPDGFNFGCQGSGPAQLALAILLDLTDPAEAEDSYQDFKRQFVANWTDPWVLTEAEAREWLSLSRTHVENRRAPV
jgi:hypothetical protein